MKSFLSSQKFQEVDTQVWAINFQQRKEPLFSLKIHSDARNRLSPASVEWGEQYSVVLEELSKERQAVDEYDALYLNGEVTEYSGQESNSETDVEDNPV
ncbi:hypothetical protein AVEN_189073-1 [Araneus ventricosus]|uniref:Uncharacterized protein n=1 Tax=Araneus ventricosus TaxID=182803 RepID=A0A4Y2L2E8_ARAVE|nr:hypothetical protein AVEN_189073-1 [Araneus ventricosus]